MKGEEQKGNSKVYKIITVGNSTVGKTAIIKRFISNKFDENMLTSLGMNVSPKKIKVKDGEEVTLKIIDTAGQERYKSLGKNYYKNADGVLFVFALNNSESFEDISKWIEIFEESNNNPKNIIKYLIGNKNDLEEEIEVKEEDTNKFLENNSDFTYKSISAKKEDNCVNDLFQEMAERMYERECREGNDIRRNSVKVLSYNKGPRKKCVFIKCLS